MSVQLYRADYEGSWRPADSKFRLTELRSAYISPTTQHSIRELNWNKLTPLLWKHLTIDDLWWGHENQEQGGPAGGYRDSPGKTRIGQQRFREEMLDRYQNTCAFTGPQPPQALEAAHL